MYRVLHLTEPSDPLAAVVATAAEGRLDVHHVTPEQTAVEWSEFDVVLIGDVLLPEPVTGRDGGPRFLQLTRGHNISVDVESLNRGGVTVAGSAPVLAQHIARHALRLAICSMLDHGPRGMQSAANISAVLDENREPLAGKTLGIIGFGRSGQAMANHCSPLGMQVIYADVRTAQHGAEKASGARRSTLDLLLSKSDIISLHTPWGPTANPLISAREFRLMQDGAVVVDTADARLVDIPALEKSVRTGKIRAGFDIEQPVASEIASLPGTVVTPYSAARTEKTDVEVAEFVVGNIVKALSGGIPAGIVEVVDYPRAGDPAFWSSRMSPRMP